MRRGWTLTEMLISLSVAGLIVSLAGSAAVGQLRFFRGVGEASELRTQVAQAVTITANVLRDVGSATDILVATDSALEAAVTTGVSVACATDTGAVTFVATRAPAGNTLASFAETPAPGDAIHLLASDSARIGWLRATIASAPAPTACARFGVAGWRVRLAEPFVVAAGAAVRVTRRTRISTYRAADGLWYVGMKDWNPDLGRFNTIQPVAGPLRPFSRTPSLTGFRFTYLDSAGGALAEPVSAASISVIAILARGITGRPARVSGTHSAATPFHVDTAAIAVAIRP